MTGRTHDLAAFTALLCVTAYYPIPPLSLSTAVVTLGSNLLGGLLPDIDDATSDFWDKIPAGSFFGRILHPLFGHHRMISHSLIGMLVAGFILKYFLEAIRHTLLVDMNIVWWGIMLGYLSHLIMDSLTIEGVPWFFPIPIRFGFPPIKFFRIKTGGLMESLVIFPGLFILNGYILYTHYSIFYLFVKNFFR